MEIFNNSIQFKIFIMQHKSKLNLSVVILVIGLGILPTGLFIKGYLTDQVSSKVAPFLSVVEEEALIAIEEDYLSLGVSETLESLSNGLIPITEEWALIKGIPTTLLYLQNTTLIELPKFINASRAALAISNAIDDVIEVNKSTTTNAMNAFFNNYTFQDDFSSTIQGVSEYMTTGSYALNYSLITMARLLDGDFGIPGLLTDLELGTGVINWLQFYSYAKANISDYRNSIENAYYCNWSSGQLQNLSAYITTHLFDEIVKSQYAPLNLTAFTELIFYSQWANASMVSSGFNLNLFSENITANVVGLEAGRPIPTNITLQTTKDLWDPLNNYSFTNDIGVWMWYLAIAGNSVNSGSLRLELQTNFALDDLIMDILFNWLVNIVANNLVPLIFPLPHPIGSGMEILDYAEILLMEQWANGTHYSEGINLSAGVKGFEVGIPTKSNISLTSATALFNTSNNSSLVHIKGIVKWMNAYQGDTTAQNEIIGTFNLTTKQLDLITTWLFTSFRYDVTPEVTYIYTATTMSTYAQLGFYYQWSDGTLFPSGIDLGPILGLSLISGWELGLPTSTNINETISAQLWSAEEELSLIHYKGISIWFRAMKVGDLNYDYLMNHFGLTDNQMDAILDWLVNIREIFAVPIAQLEANFPVDHYTLGNNIYFGFLIGGSIIAVIGVLGIVLLSLFKKR